MVSIATPRDPYGMTGLRHDRACRPLWLDGTKSNSSRPRPRRRRGSPPRAQRPLVAGSTVERDGKISGPTHVRWDRAIVDDIEPNCRMRRSKDQRVHGFVAQESRDQSRLRGVGRNQSRSPGGGSTAASIAVYGPDSLLHNLADRNVEVGTQCLLQVDASKSTQGWTPHYLTVARAVRPSLEMLPAAEPARASRNRGHRLGVRHPGDP
jgi:hypothetical protein